ncbi:uncharacterized protein LOC111040078 [Myzus persicae]|uniref:uncharacterized protein LOC111040078 n=1 Tax=Myzus persicae TaxID=13164 RepID=UPI000B932C18|nr:uncharacterized protein LOC111040078 [Myzus persicae]
MSTVFKTNLRPILSLGKILGLIDVSYTLEPDGFLIKNINSSYFSLLEILRMIVLLICTYIVHTANAFYYINEYRLIKFWAVIIAGRISEKWTIKLINAIIEFDQKIKLLSTVILEDRQWSLSKINWNYIIISLCIYFIGFELYDIYVWPPRKVDIYIVTVYFFGVPYITDYVVIVTVSFYLINIGHRFQTINNLWKCLPVGLIAVPGKWTNLEIVMLMENIRMLHAELSEILKIFNLGYGLMLLIFFVFNFIDMMYTFYITIKHEFVPLNVLEIIIRSLPLHFFKLQIVIFMLSIIVAASWINEKKKKIISYLRSNRISNLPVGIKNQIKLFMNQISISELDEITAFGFFNINLNLVVSILVLLMTGLTTLIQMKNRPIILEMFNNTELFNNNWGNVFEPENR